ncbi:MAG: DPP IV N-terminal domain-containing protein [Actinomycetota bacterium]|nr:DPP IV N-terminal domain-containing protein [Actinomycetota bacterium]
MYEKMRLTPEAIATRPIPGFTRAVSPRFSADGAYLYFLWPERGAELSLKRIDCASGEEELIAAAGEEKPHLTLEEELRRERLRMTWGGISGFDLAEGADGATLVVLNRGGRFFVLNETCTEMIADFSDDDFAAFAVAPGGRKAVAANEEGLWSIDLSSHRRKLLLANSEPVAVYGVAEYVAQEELDRLEGFWISPDGTQVAFTEVDESEVPEFPLVHMGGDDWTLERHRYPFAGEANAKVRLCVTGIDGGALAWVPLPEDSEFYLAKVLWLGNQHLVAATVDRLQQHLKWWIYDLKHLGLSLIHEERGNPWVNLPVGAIAIGEESLLTTTEKSGFAQLCEITVSGEAHPHELGDWMVTNLVAVLPESRAAFFMATEAGPLERHLYRLDLDQGSMSRVTETPGMHDALVDPTGSHVLDQWSNRAAGVRSELRLAGGTMMRIGAEPPTAEELGLVPPQLFTVTAATGETLHGAVYLPAGRGSGLRPGVVSVYGGPHAQTVNDSWELLTADLVAQHLASQGVVVVKLDNRGSTARGKAFEAHLYRRFASAELEDQLLAVKHIIEHHQVDPARIGIYGWSYGGFMTIRALTGAPEVFKAGVAGAPVVDFRYYDTAYTERYLGLPADSAEAYESSDLARAAGSLAGKLLVIHGLADENVHFRNTARFLEAATREGKQVDLMLLPASRHSPRGFETLREIARRRAEYLLDNL